MAIPESQLETWSHQGSVTQSKTSYQTIRNALTASNASYADKSFDVFLQGSYRNDTNIYAESDVDIVIRLDAIFGHNASDLSPDQQTTFHKVFSGSASYTLAEFKQGVAGRLSAAFGNDVGLGTKAIKIKANGSRRSADVVVCYQYRRYVRFLEANNYEFVPGINFLSKSGSEIINYPKAHSDNCTAKHQATNSWFKPMVRIIKNMRGRLVDSNVIAPDVAPSYYIECMLYNVPIENFGGSYANTFMNSVNWLYAAEKVKLVCPNGQYWLLGNSNVQWTSVKCDLFLNALIKLWNEW
jgi:hypothetical protein